MATKTKIVRVHTPSKAALEKAGRVGASVARRRANSEFDGVLGRIVTIATGGGAGLIDSIWNPGHWLKMDWTLWLGGVGGLIAVLSPSSFNGKFGRTLAASLTGFATVASYKMASPIGALGDAGSDGIGGTTSAYGGSGGYEVGAEVIEGEYASAYMPDDG